MSSDNTDNSTLSARDAFANGMYPKPSEPAPRLSTEDALTSGMVHSAHWPKFGK